MYKNNIYIFIYIYIDIGFVCVFIYIYIYLSIGIDGYRWCKLFWNFTPSMLPNVPESTHPCVSSPGTSLKKEINATSFCTDLPKDNNLRKTLEQYRQRFEESLEEFFGCTRYWKAFPSLKPSCDVHVLSKAEGPQHHG